MTIRHVILDRDGVLNREAPDHGYVLTRADFHWLPGALEALALLHGHGIRLSVASNQSAVGRGLLDLARLEDIMSYMREQARAAGGAIDAVFFCPHAPDTQCECRKPRPGMLLDALRASGIPAEQTVFVGDDVRDVEAADAAGITPVIVRTGKGAQTESRLRSTAVTPRIYDNLLQFAHTLTRTPT